MVWVSVVDGNLFTRANITQGEEGHLLAGHNPHESIRRARVIDGGSFIAADSSIDGELCVQCDDLDDLLTAQARLNAATTTDEFAGIKRDLLAGAQGHEREAAFSVNIALSNLYPFRCADLFHLINHD